MDNYKNQQEEKSGFNDIINGIDSDYGLKKNQLQLEKTVNIVDSQSKNKKNKMKSSNNNNSDDISSTFIEVNLYSSCFMDSKQEKIRSVVKLDDKKLIAVTLGLSNHNNNNNILRSPNGNMLIAEGTPYSIAVYNDSGFTQTVGIFQTNPNDDPSGFPLVWASHSISNKGTGYFYWDTTWGLTWGTSNIPLSNGATFRESGANIASDPTNPDENGANITYSSDWEITSAGFKDLPEGSLEIQTDKTFTNGDAINANFNVACTMDGAPVFAMVGKPNTTYTFQTHPTYYLSTIDSKVGNAVTGQAVGGASKVIFVDGKDNVSCTLNNKNEFTDFQAVN